MRVRLRLKMSGRAVMPWRCVVLGHHYGPFERDGWRHCRRQWCTSIIQWGWEPEGRPSA